MDCFYCGLIVGDMTADRDPWVIHAQLAPGCPFVLNVKGFRFVNDVAIILGNTYRLRYGLESKLQRCLYHVPVISFNVAFYVNYECRKLVLTLLYNLLLFSTVVCRHRKAHHTSQTERTSRTTRATTAGWEAWPSLSLRGTGGNDRRERPRPYWVGPAYRCCFTYSCELECRRVGTTFEMQNLLRKSVKCVLSILWTCCLLFFVRQRS